MASAHLQFIREIKWMLLKMTSANNKQKFFLGLRSGRDASLVVAGLLHYWWLVYSFKWESLQCEEKTVYTERDNTSTDSFLRRTTCVHNTMTTSPCLMMSHTDWRQTAGLIRNPEASSSWDRPVWLDVAIVEKDDTTVLASFQISCFIQFYFTVKKKKNIM